jgi:peptidoglycan/LPS O-acetylase OafA/YrhL
LSAIAVILVTSALFVAFYVSIVKHDCLNQGKCLNVTYDAGFLRCIGSFFLGVLAFKLNRVMARSPYWRMIKWLDILVLGLLFLVIQSATVMPIIAFATPFVAAGLVAVLPLQGPASFVLSRKPLLWLGQMSFSIYLGHQSILTVMEAISKSSAIPVYVKFVILAAALALFAVFANRFVEKPGRRYMVAMFRKLADKRRGATAANQVHELSPDLEAARTIVE